MSTVRDLVFRDDQGHTKKFAFGDHEHLKFSKAFDAFLRAHLNEDNTTFRIERVRTEETLVIESAVGVIARTRGGHQPVTEYLHYGRHTDMTDYAIRFAHSGYSALDQFGPWASDRDTVLPDESFVNLELAHLREVEAHEARRRAIRQMPKLDRKLLTTFCTAWADHGYVERLSSDVECYVLFDTRRSELAGGTREELVAVVQALGLEIVDTPEGRTPRELWVRTDPRVDLELGKWA